MRKSCQRLIYTFILICLFTFFVGCDRISGIVTGDVQEGVTITLSGDLTATATTFSNGSYVFEEVDNGTYTIKPSLIGYTFTPASRTVTVPDDDTTSVDFTATEEQVERFTDNGDGTVTDARTGLVWLKDANCYGHMNWGDAVSFAAGLNSGECGLSDGSAEGDWRLPTKDELQRIGTNPPTTWPSGFPYYDFGIEWNRPEETFASVQFHNYWSSTEYDTGYMWVVSMIDGLTVSSGYRDYYHHYVWPVRYNN